MVKGTSTHSHLLTGTPCWGWEQMTWDLKTKAQEAHLRTPPKDEPWTILGWHTTGHQKTVATSALHSRIT